MSLPIDAEAFGQLLAKHGVINAEAIEDAAAYDGCLTLASCAEALNELRQMESDYKLLEALEDAVLWLGSGSEDDAVKAEELQATITKAKGLPND